MVRNSLLIIFFLCCFGSLRGQKFPEKGVPFIQNYLPEEYGDSGKIWAIQSAKNGIVYFASNKGLLEFDGQNWNRFKGSKGFTRSLVILEDSLFYSGADKDFGRWDRNELQAFEFTSLNPFRESTKGVNEEFWGVHHQEDEIVFVSFNNVYVYKQGQLTKIAAPFRFTGSFQVDGKLYLADEKYGLFDFNGLTLTNIFSYPNEQQPLEVIGLEKHPDGLLVITRNQGLFTYNATGVRPVNNEVATYLQKHQVFCFTPIDDTHYAFGTILDGVYITDLAGNIIQHINKQKGLPNNTILSMHYSQEGKLWLGMDFGLSAIHLWSDIAYVLDHQGKTGTGQAAFLLDETFYLGTNQGLYTTSWERLRNDAEEADFNLVPGSAGQVWTLEWINGALLCGHDRGLFQVVGKSLVKLHDEAGVWAIQQLGEHHLLTGNYDGVSLFENRNGQWFYTKKMAPILGACSQVEIVGLDTLWLNIPNYGIIKASIDSSFEIVNQHIFPAETFVGQLPQIKIATDQIQVYTDQNVYQYSANGNTFTAIPASIPANRIANNLPGYYLPKSLDSAYAFYPIYNGFALQNIRYNDAPNTSLPLVIRYFTAFSNDTIRYCGNNSIIPYHLHNLKVHYTIPQQEHIQYQYKLANLDQDWSNWSTQNSIEYIDLPPGTFTFSVKAKVNGQETAPQRVTFTITPPWYRTALAYIIYALLACTFLYLNYLWQHIRLKRQRQNLLQQEQNSLRRQAEAYEQETLIQQKRILEVELATAKKQLRGKTIELAKKAKESEDKNRVLLTLKEKINASENEGKITKFHWNQLSRILAAYSEKEDNSFNIQMEELHQEFFAKLNTQFPELTTYDLRLCVYLKTGLTTKEIAELTNVLASSVNVSRSRLRKKLKLEPKENLIKFLNSI